MSLQERVWGADVILVGRVTKSYDTGIVKEAGIEQWQAECRVGRILKGHVENRTIHIRCIRIPMTSDPPQQLLAGETYLLFLKEAQRGVPAYELINPYHGALEYQQSHQWIYDEATGRPQAAPMTGKAITDRVVEIVSDTTMVPHQVRLEQVQQLAAQITAGTTRAQVEAWFKQRDGGLQDASVTRYYEQPGVVIEVPFNHTGGNWSRENQVDGPIKVYQSPPSE